MSEKNSNTTSDYIPYDHAMRIGKKLIKDNKYSFAGRYIIIAVNTGLRNSDIIKLTYEDLKQETVTFNEHKTGKRKTVKINNHIHDIISKNDFGSPFLTQKKTVITIQYLNRILKEIFRKEAKTLNISTHSLRKSFGRHVYEVSGETEKSLLLLMDLFNHSNLYMVKKYLGIRQEELNNIYDML